MPDSHDCVCNCQNAAPNAFCDILDKFPGPIRFMLFSEVCNGLRQLRETAQRGREILRGAAALAGGCALSHAFPKSLFGETPRFARPAPAAPIDGVIQARHRFENTPIESVSCRTVSPY